MAAAIIAGLNAPMISGYFNIGTGHICSNIEIAEVFCKVFNNQKGIVFLKDEQETGIRTCMDCKKAKEELQFIPQYNVLEFVQDIKKEYKLESDRFYDLTELIETIFGADDILGIKTAFISEIIEIIVCLHEEDSQYTPVVRQIMSEVQQNYKEDMNLKTMAYKYHMNASYLGQIFQKEVGCSFARYLSNTKNGIAKELILNTKIIIQICLPEVILS